ncbi:DUF1844 domain-containing protein [Candidatus Bathyarchaeota archaeon]|nr:DUF1844 domain-containing protein [Candidatus Bathyarchaeota archaeon]
MGEEGEKKMGQGPVDISALDIYPILGFFVSILSAKAWQYMGLRVDPKTQTIKKDFKKAILTIDCVAFIIDKLAPQLEDEERNKLRSLLTDLQINYVSQQKSSE